MRLKIVPCSRSLPLLPSILVLSLVAGVGAVYLLSGGSAILCHLRRITGLPCPTCGSTRAALALVRGDIASALSFNPLTVLVLVVFAAVMAARLALARQIVIAASGREWVNIAILVLVALALNWVWVLRGHGML